MSVNLEKGQRVDLTKGRPSLHKLLIGLGWDTNHYDGESDFDLDASVFITGANGKVGNDKDFVFYGNLSNSTKSVIHTGDNRTGDGEGDDEVIKVNLQNLPNNSEKISVAVTIYDANNRLQNFGMVENAYIRVLDEETGEQLLRYDLSEDFLLRQQLLLEKFIDATMNGSLKQLEVVITVDLKHYVAHTELMLNRRISI